MELQSRNCWFTKCLMTLVEAAYINEVGSGSVKRLKR